ncbi:unnamed protein product [Phytophthora fragariaefolia]|uniref:Unnamed protein product n=1 Tax=Phytophthora fragariaefolia TaxID=1490495 RepID=A0A9W7DB21_9STRA|nr:unnamed protein product [Phytophthora fragariaefolia]
MEVTTAFGLIVIRTPRGRRVILPPSLWPVVFKDCHDSVWAGHLRATHTYARIAQLYWWSNLQREVKSWVRGCQECGSRKARPREVIPPLRSLGGGDAGDRWALDVAGPVPISDGGQRYVIASVEYVTRYAVAVAVEEHTAERVAKILMQSVVPKFGVFRELLTDGVPELTGKSMEQLVLMLQAEQVNPVPYRPQMVGLVERFNRTWKDLVATYMHKDGPNDWNVWIDFAVCPYDSGKHSTVAISPNELMLGRRLRPPNELLRKTNAREAGELTIYHQSNEEQSRAAADIEAQLEYESQPEGEVDDEASRETTGATAAAVHAFTTKRTGKQPYRAGGAEDAWERPSKKLVELRRRRRRKKAGHYVLEYELQPVRPKPGAPNGDKRWVSITEYDELFEHDRVVEDSGFEEGV